MSDDGSATDAIGTEAAQIMRVLLQIMILIATRARTAGQREGEARAKMAQIREKEARQQQLREAREAKRIDPRNKALLKELSKSRMVARDTFAKERAPRVSLEKARVPMRWDSDERRAHLAAHVSRLAPSKEVADVRMLHDLGQGKPAAHAIDRTPEAGARRAAEARARDAREIRERAERNGQVRSYT